MVFTTTYNNIRSRWVVVPTVVATVTAAGVFYAWLKDRSGSIWPVALAHGVVNVLIDGTTGDFVPGRLRPHSNRKRLSHPGHNGRRRSPPTNTRPHLVNTNTELVRRLLPTADPEAENRNLCTSRKVLTTSKRIGHAELTSTNERRRRDHGSCARRLVLRGSQLATNFSRAATRWLFAKQATEEPRTRAGGSWRRVSDGQGASVPQAWGSQFAWERRRPGPSGPGLLL
ncbi:CPBP family intramembrane glutamic endopeptidase [Kribbella sp. NPDC023855]|uniref:CPBP family intramembrane glutamic endopeptidase n=1 Tax=Kribbella sp. NPDC023855 TaxID=3154698 RepID=UPI0033E4EEA7